MSYSNGLLSDQSYQTANKYVQGLPGVGFKLTDTGDYDMQNKKLVNVKNGVNGSGAVTKSLLDTKTSLLDGARTHGYIVNNKAVIYSQSGAVHAKSFYLQDQNEDEVRILTDNQDFDNVHLFVPNLKNFDGFGGRKRSEIMVTSVDQTVSGNTFFQNIKAPNPSEDGDVANKNYVDFEITKQNVLIDNEFVKKSGSLMTGDLILPHYNYPVQGNTNKAISYETQREVFLSRKESFPMETVLNMNNNIIENLKNPINLDDGVNKKYVDDGLTKKMDERILKDVNLNNKQLKNLGYNINDPTDVVNLGFTDQKYLQKVSDSDLNMDDHRVINSLDPIGSQDLTTKKYVDGEIGKIPHSSINTSTFVKIDGSRAMVGDLNMDDHRVINSLDPIGSQDLTTKKYVDGEIGKIPHSSINTSTFVKIDGSRAMVGDLNMDGNKIIRLASPIDDTDVTNKKYIDEKLLKSHLISSKIENVFTYLSDINEISTERDIIFHALVDFNNSPHKNKKAFDIDMVYSGSSHDYNSKFGVNLYPLNIGKYTIIMEYYYPENLNITINAEVTKKTTTINKQLKSNETNHQKILVQFDFPSKVNPPHYLFFNIRGSGTTSTNPEGYIVLYGVKGWDDQVPSKLYDHALETGMFEYDNGNMKMFNDIDMNSYKIKNISPAVINPNDLLMKK